MKWLYLIFRPCRHRWKIVNYQKTYETAGDKLPVEQKIILQCEKCGDIKTRKV
jgi:hypothetical protein